MSNIQEITFSEEEVLEGIDKQFKVNEIGRIIARGFFWFMMFLSLINVVYLFAVPDPQNVFGQVLLAVTLLFCAFTLHLCGKTYLLADKCLEVSKRHSQKKLRELSKH